jgi:hypothetical protein
MRVQVFATRAPAAFRGARSGIFPRRCGHAREAPYTAKGRLVDPLLLGENLPNDLPSSLIVAVADAPRNGSSHLLR